jgi:conjugal transfer pilus assembly protein TraV
MRWSCRRSQLAAALALPSLVALPGCATFGGNVRGDFSCAAPDGICAPSSTIDDRALAIISSDDAEGLSVPPRVGPSSKAASASRVALARPERPGSADAGRTREKVLRIVFQPYIDDRGRLHEASAVHAVVASGEWQQAAMQQPAQPAVAAGTFLPRESLADAVDRVDPPQTGMATTDPMAPDPAAIAAARARKSDPVAAIKAEVATRLAPKADASPLASGNRQALPLAADGLRVPAAPVGQRSAGSVPESAPAKAGQSGLPDAGAAAITRVKSDPAYRSVAGGVAQEARDAAAQSGAVPAKPAPTVRAPNFPAAVSGEN